jgi:hypothetical protein
MYPKTLILWAAALAVLAVLTHVIDPFGPENPITVFLLGFGAVFLACGAGATWLGQHSARR